MKLSSKLLFISLLLLESIHLRAATSIIDKHWFPVAFIIFGIILVGLFAILVIRMNLDYKRAAKDLQQEIAQRKEARSTLLASEKKYKILLENLKDIIFTFDNEGIITYVSNSVEDALGFSPVELIGKPIDVLIDPEIKEETLKSIKDGLSGSKIDQFQTSTISKNGEKIYLEITASRLWDGKIQTGALAVSRVINERKKAEEQKQLLLNDLEEINSELTNFAYIVSHDLKAPLRAIDSLAHWILEDYAKSFDKEGKEQMSLLIKRVDRMHNLIEGILEYSRVGRVKENMIEINLNILLSEVIEMIAPPDNFQITIEDEFPTIVAEEVRIKQVFQNLLSNAVKFNDKKEGVINLNCRYDTDRWIFEVSDNGPGIEKKYFEKIFGIFQTLVSRDTFESTGIGLSLIKKIVSVYGGEVWVESVLGEGSSFYFTIPKKIGEQQ